MIVAHVLRARDDGVSAASASTASPSSSPTPAITPSSSSLLPPLPASPPSSTVISNQLMVRLLGALVGITLLALILLGILLLLRYRRRAKRTAAASAFRSSASSSSLLPLYDGREDRTSSPNHRRLTISAGKFDSVYLMRTDKQLDDESVESSISLPDTLPEIRITLPDELDASGKRRSGRVVIVRLGDHGAVGLEPLFEEYLPPYQRTSGPPGFQSLDLEHIGGLKEKAPLH